ncbi:unnamed protein product [Porites evermanni]|uniref:Porimin n=1 Tax=Porites evermanni TaxID=104178 RepID=A0ABN8T4E1_9CNID|nr:unnamed protein product [Porites evermanni]
MFTVHGQNNTTIGIASSTISRVLTPSHHLTSTPIVMPSTTSNIKPTPTTTVSSVTVTVRPTTSNVSTVPTPGSSSTPTSKPGNHSTTVPTTNVKPSPVTPSPKGSSSGKWVATGFAVLFGITTIVMTVLYCRQRKIYRELEGDSSLSRLI